MGVEGDLDDSGRTETDFEDKMGCEPICAGHLKFAFAGGNEGLGVGLDFPAFLLDFFAINAALSFFGINLALLLLTGRELALSEHDVPPIFA